MPDKHAFLAPSAAKRWMTCAPSAKAESEYPERQTSYTKEGTLAHSLAELMLNWYKKGHEPMEFDMLKQLHWPIGGTIKLEKQAREAGIDFLDMAKTVHDYYVLPVFEDYVAARAIDSEAELLIEAELDLSSYVPEGFGSSDAVIIYDDCGVGKLKVYDLKYGKGVKVEAENNPQMMCYALGALFGQAELFGIDMIYMHIVQPRLRHFSTAEMTYEELVNWGVHVLRPAAMKAFRGEGDFIPGDHCKFCKAAPRCRALYLMSTVTAAANAEPEQLSDKELAEVLKSLDSIKSWVTKIEDYATEHVLSGGTIPGWKLVEGRSLRKISDQQAVINSLVDAGFDRDLFLKPRELKTLTDLQKMLRKEAFNDIVGPYVIKPQGKPTLVPESDPRPTFSSAENDFENI